ncbi:hypothetical protein M2277_005123 [Paenibacillus sp. LBL]|uniref:hypothetical protein n=1 Tax=Paenibacillus sp. LBL TaxID=2940563 RepID=UPI0024753170|nr:hypothetical protein [Paenibacillus sp. LBL]MDH6674431.1 hypothetical protein [Paenibacillus sp. LBL]
MTYFDDYINRMNATGTSISDAYRKSTVEKVNSSFADSTSFRIIKINGVDTDSRVTDGADSKVKDVLLRPDTTVNLGDHIEFNNEKWLVFDCSEKDVFPKASIQSCNEMLRWVKKDGTYAEYDAVVRASRYIKYAVGYNRFDVNLLEGGMFVYVVINDDTRSISPLQRFIIGSSVYEVTGIDDMSFTKNGLGLLQFTTRLSTVKVGDDFSTKIADNSELYLGETGGTNNGPGTGGGDLW